MPRYGIEELTVQHNGGYQNKFFDASLDALFVSPAGAQHSIKGFFYGRDLWKVRFRADEVGRWIYTYAFSAKNGFRSTGQGQFEVTSSDAAGPVRQSLENPYRWVFANGRPYFPVGLQDCTPLKDGKLTGGVIDGGSRDQGGRMLSWDQYFLIYGEAGFNLFRFSQMNCSFNLYDDLDHYREAESMATDELLATARRHGFRIMFGFFGFNWNTQNRYLRYVRRKLRGIFGNAEEAAFSPNDPDTLAKQKRFIDYCIARWGVYVDFWELLNETKATDAGTTVLADYVHAVDPDHKPVGTSWEKPYLKSIDFNGPHWYTSEDERQSDLVVQQEASKWKAAGKPVIVGEHGNTGMNWDPRSAVRMRIRTWTALFQEIGFVFWNTAWSKFGMYHGHYAPGQVANIYLGPEERGYIRALHDFSEQLDATVAMAPIAVQAPVTVRGYGLTSDNVIAAYFVNGANHNATINGAVVDIPTKGAMTGEWIDPATGRTIAPATLQRGQSRLQAPPFTIDLALILKPEQRP